MIAFNVPNRTEHDASNVLDALMHRTSGGQSRTYTLRCLKQLSLMLDVDVKRLFLVNSCTSALEISAILANVMPGDEIILPSFTFSSTATAFARLGAKLVFVDIDPMTMNIDPRCVRAAITDHTRAIVIMHYAGNACNVHELLDIASDADICVIEDAAQCVLSSFDSKPLGTFGSFGCWSFHDTKNITSGEGGLLYVHNEQLIDRASMIINKGTNVHQFELGASDQYTWIEASGSSYVMSDLNAAMLSAQLDCVFSVTKHRRMLWLEYERCLRSLSEEGLITLPTITHGCMHNAHIFYVILRSVIERQSFIEYMMLNGVDVRTHYVPLHSSPAGLLCSRFNGIDMHTTDLSARLVRLPMHMQLSCDDVNAIASMIKSYFMYERNGQYAK